jgi:hypothetical protein
VKLETAALISLLAWGQPHGPVTNRRQQAAGSRQQAFIHASESQQAIAVKQAVRSLSTYQVVVRGTPEAAAQNAVPQLVGTHPWWH